MERVAFDVEYLFRASPKILYKFFTDASAIIRWFCDEARVEGDTYIFSWEGSEEEAKLVEDIEEERLRFIWDDAESEEEYWEIRFKKAEVTGETILEITEFCDDDEVEEQKQYWETLIKSLRTATGG